MLTWCNTCIFSSVFISFVFVHGILQHLHQKYLQRAGQVGPCGVYVLNQDDDANFYHVYLFQIAVMCQCN